MRQQLIDLWEIQQIDLQIRELEKQKEHLPAGLNSLRERIDGTRAELNELGEQREALATEIRAVESTITQENDKVRKWERRLNEIRNQREYQALSREVEGSRRAVRTAEEQQVELFAKRDELEKRIEVLQDQLAEDEVDAQAEEARVQEELGGLEQKITAEGQRRDKLVPKIKPNLLRRYDAIRQKRLGQGLVPARDGSCTGCNMRLPPQAFNILMRGDSLETCPSCNRILVFQGLLEEATPVPTPTTSEAVEASP